MKIVLFALVLNLAYIEYSLYQIWSVYMQYLRCCDHSKNCLFLVLQQAEVVLNFFLMSVYESFMNIEKHSSVDSSSDTGP